MSHRTKSSAVSAPSVVLNNGERIPIVGLGTWKSAPGEVQRAVEDAIDAGYRHIDGAHFYQNEDEVGAAVNAKIAAGIVRRSDIFLTSKLWVTDHHVDRVRAGLMTTLNNLNTPYLDLYLIHLPTGLEYADGEMFPKDPATGKMRFSDDDFVDTWRELERAVDDGLVRTIGISNFNREQTERLLANCRIRPAVNQVEVHPYLTQQKLIGFLRAEGITVTGYSPLGSPDRPWAKAGDPVLLEHPIIQALAEKYRKSTAQILIRYQIERGVVVIPKSVTKSRIVSNFNVFDFQLTEDDVEQINGFECNGRFVPMAS